MNSSLLKKLVFALSVVFFVSCDKDYNGIGADMIEDDIHHNGIEQYIVNPVAFDKASGPVQANNLPVNSLGAYDNPAFGKTIAHFVTQLELASENPVFTSPVIDSVYLYVPYFSELESTDTAGMGTYTLDSIYGDANAKFRLHIYENGYFLRTTDPASSGQVQKYFSDDKPLIEGSRGNVLLNNSASPSENEEFYFNSAEIQRTYNRNGVTVIKERLAPGMYFQLNNDFFVQKILQAPAGKLINNNVFKDYFRGIYFNVEQLGGQSVIGKLRFSEGRIAINYHDDEYDVNGQPTGNRVSKTITLNLKGNTINFFDNTLTGSYSSALAASNQEQGDDRLYIKGGEGSMAFITIKDNDLDFLREETSGKRSLINEANLVFYIDQAAMNGVKEPMRLYLYDVKNKRPLYDYFVDVTTNNADSKYNKQVHGGVIQRNSDNRGTQYKIRITDHINNLVNKDSTNVTLGLVVTENINVVANAAIRNYFTVPGDPGSIEVQTVPVSDVTNPLGTILYGILPEGSQDYNKRLKLEIFYTKPD